MSLINKLKKDKPKNIDSFSLMQQFLNVCPILDHSNKQNIEKKFEIIGPVNISDILQNTQIDPNQISIALI